MYRKKKFGSGATDITITNYHSDVKTIESLQKESDSYEMLTITSVSEKDVTPEIKEPDAEIKEPEAEIKPEKKFDSRDCYDCINTLKYGNFCESYGEPPVKAIKICEGIDFKPRDFEDLAN